MARLYLASVTFATLGLLLSAAAVPPLLPTTTANGSSRLFPNSSEVISLLSPVQIIDNTDKSPASVCVLSDPRCNPLAKRIKPRLLGMTGLSTHTDKKLKSSRITKGDGDQAITTTVSIRRYILRVHQAQASIDSSDISDNGEYLALISEEWDCAENGKPQRWKHFQALTDAEKGSTDYYSKFNDLCTPATRDYMLIDGGYGHKGAPSAVTELETYIKADKFMAKTHIQVMITHNDGDHSGQAYSPYKKKKDLYGMLTGQEQNLFEDTDKVQKRKITTLFENNIFSRVTDDLFKSATFPDKPSQEAFRKEYIADALKLGIQCSDSQLQLPHSTSELQECKKDKTMSYPALTATPTTTMSRRTIDNDIHFQAVFGNEKIDKEKKPDRNYLFSNTDVKSDVGYNKFKFGKASDMTVVWPTVEFFHCCLLPFTGVPYKVFQEASKIPPAGGIQRVKKINEEQPKKSWATISDPAVLVNRMSLSVLVNLQGHDDNPRGQGVLTGDAFCTDVLENLAKISKMTVENKIAFWKVPHHGADTESYNLETCYVKTASTTAAGSASSTRAPTTTGGTFSPIDADTYIFAGGKYNPKLTTFKTILKSQGRDQKPVYDKNTKKCVLPDRPKQTLNFIFSTNQLFEEDVTKNTKNVKNAKKVKNAKNVKNVFSDYLLTDYLEAKCEECISPSCLYYNLYYVKTNLQYISLVVASVAGNTPITKINKHAQCGRECFNAHTIECPVECG